MALGIPNLSQLVMQIATQLTQKKWLLATAESCTGGGIAAALTEQPGSSHWFERGFVTYSNAAKRELLDVSTTILDQYGAVSEQAAYAMAVGALNHSAAQITLAVTGIAGPEGGSRAKPVGTICFAWARSPNHFHTETHCFAGDRQQIRQQACIHALRGLLQLVNSESSEAM